jgi:basic membrane protein A and related proteins
MGRNEGRLRVNAVRKLWWLAILVLSLTLALGATGCGSSDSNTGTNASPGTGTQAAPALKVGLVTDIGGLNDKSFNQLAYQGLQQAEADLGVEIKALESKSNADYIPNLQSLAEEGYDLVIAVGFLMQADTQKAAETYPDTNFAIIDATFDPATPNSLGILFKEQEAGYLVGYLAGLTTKTGTVSSVGGQKIPPVDHYIAGYQKGAADAKPGVKVLNAYSQDFVDQAKCKELALDQIANGSDVVFQVAGGCGLGALDAAKEKSVWGIGVDADQGYLGDYVLTSALKRVNVAVFETIKTAVDNSFAGGESVVFALADDGVGMGEISPNADQAAVDETNAQIDGITSGDIVVPDTVERRR